MKTCTIIGGGPSVNTIDWTPERFPHIIAVNNGWEIAPWAEILFFGDGRWWETWDNKSKVLGTFEGRIITDSGVEKHHRLERRERTADEKCIDRPNYVLAPDSGTKAMCVAYHEGYERIQLAGFDLCADAAGKTHFHDHHKGPPTKGFGQLFGDMHFRMLLMFQKRGIELVRITEPGHERIPYEPAQSHARLRSGQA